MAIKITKIKFFNNLLGLAAGHDVLEGEELSDAALSFPNLLSLLRLLMAPLIIALLLDGSMLLAFYCFIFAALTDAFDGWYAKTFGAQTRFGAFLDPMADKVLIISVYLWLSLGNLVPDWLTVLIISRDFLILAGVLVTLIVFDKIWIAPLGAGKITTFTQLILIGLILLKAAYPSFTLQKIEIVIEVGIYVVACFTLFSVFAYVLQWFLRITTPLNGAKGKEK